MRIGIDLGGTKTEGILIHSNGETITRFSRSTPVNNYSAIIRNIVSIVDELQQICAVDPQPTIGIGIPGSVSLTTGLVKNANTTCLIGKPFNRDLEQALNQPIRMANDANCFTLSEAVDGAASECKTVFGVILGTGVGGGICIDKKPLNGCNSISGEWGHNPLPWAKIDQVESEHPGPKCYCGKNGCIETFLSGPGMSYDHSIHYGEKLSPEQIISKSREGDINAGTTLRRYISRLARAISSVINIIDPDVVVLGGGLSNINELYHDVPEIWGKWVFSDDVKTRLVKNRHGASSGVRGAAWQWDSNKFRI